LIFKIEKTPDSRFHKGIGNFTAPSALLVSFHILKFPEKSRLHDVIITPEEKGFRL
jgi:hypothetical protein